MLRFNNDTKVYLYSDNISFRSGIKAYTSIITSSIKKEDLDNSIFVFFNKGSNSFKIIEFETNGIFLYHYKLNKGKFIKPIISDDKVLISINDLITISSAIKLTNH